MVKHLNLSYNFLVLCSFEKITIEFVKKYNIYLDYEEIKCNFTSKNSQCIGKRCPFKIV